MEGLRRNPNRKVKLAGKAATSKMLAVERRRRNRNRNGNQAIASEAGDCDLKRKDSSVSEGGEILKRKKELFALIPTKAQLLGRKLTEEEAKRVVARETKRKKVVKTRVPQGLIDYIMAELDPSISTGIPDDELAKCSEPMRQCLAKSKLIDEKYRAYQQAILDQYNAQGYAYDEAEITDDEEEVVEN